jgi:hypothetical protein
LSLVCDLLYNLCSCGVLTQQFPSVEPKIA